MVSSSIPTVDLSPFFNEGGDEHGRKEAIETITKACLEHGFFQIVNHGIPTDLMNKALQHSKTFFQYPPEEKLKSSPRPGEGACQLPIGYNIQPDHSVDKNEYFLVFQPGSSYNVYPENLPELRSVMEDLYPRFVGIGSLMESIINDCLGLPPNFLKEYNDERSWDFMAAFHYFPATESENNGITEHEDGNCITFVFQDEVGGLEVRKDGEWIPVVPEEGSIVVNVADFIQVMSNKKFNSATHRVVRSEGKSRYSYGFFYNLNWDKWVEPLPQFTTEIGEPPKYKRFQVREYQMMRMKNKQHPPARPEDEIGITYYAIDT
ncbi:flavonol synthase/flavanone 3-hydroxylase-like [Rhodamnia argentea]|uniref:Flavonol synthase/flavanone 3-hydroxylase-like n=1 Tax=Rhodamnia argentea TaxID=178133 RepID=A0A8B8MU61_9MYRT|nr:flavonol synthase/flavanone 3-hydroxylase-like [Rhodamnia argentea]